VTMAQIWLTAAARAALEALPPEQAEAVNDAIGDITAKPGQRIDIPARPQRSRSSPRNRATPTRLSSSAAAPPPTNPETGSSCPS